MTLHLAEIAANVTPGAHARLILDGAGGHASKTLPVPDTITLLTLLTLPPYAPELNPVENLWQYLRSNALANTVFDTYANIVTACCKAWNTRNDNPKTVTSITARSWATVNQ